MKIYFKHENGFFKDGRIFCETLCLSEDETDDELLEMGWLPSMEEKNVWYQSRSCRLNMDGHIVSSKRRNVLNKLTVEISDYVNNKKIDNFFFDYYESKKYDINDLYENCSDFFKIKLVKISVGENIVGYARFTERTNSNIFLNLSYSEKYPKLSLGTNLFYVLSQYTKKQNKKYLYIYESYHDLFNYKQTFENVEIWNGRDWLKKND